MRLSDKVGFFGSVELMNDSSVEVELGKIREPADDSFFWVDLPVELESLTVVVFINDELIQYSDYMAKIRYFVSLWSILVVFIFFSIIFNEGNHVAVGDIDISGFDSAEESSNHV